MSNQESPDWQDVESRAVSLIDKGHLLQQLGRNEEALASYDQATMICCPFSNKCDRLGLVLAQALDNKANALVDLNRTAEAIPVFDEAIQVHESVARGEGSWQDVHEIATSVMNKGRALMLLERCEEAGDCFDQAIEGFEQCGSSKDVALVYLNLGSCEARTGSLEGALAWYSHSLYLWQSIIEESDVSKGDYAYALYGLADVQTKLGHLDEALEACDQAIALQRVIASQTRAPSERENLADTLEVRGNILTKLGRTKEAEECFREAVRLRKGRAS
jgi:tetratricopeptide (TPR) repeat protein